MSHVWEQRVLGGVDVPRFLLLNENLCSNPYFTKDTSGWSLLGVGTFSRIESSNSYGQYSGQMLTTGDEAYLEYSFNYGSSIANKRWLISFDATNITDFIIAFAGSTEFGAIQVSASSTLNRYIAIGDSIGQTGNTIKFRIKVFGIENNNLIFDNVLLAEVRNDYDFPQPHDSGKLVFDKSNNGETTLWSGLKKEYNAKWTPSYYCTYQFLNQLNEIFRQQLSESNLIFCMPHKDTNWGFLGKWEHKEFTRGYSFGKYFGHEGVIGISGCEYFRSKPFIQSSDVIYIDDDIIV